MNLRPLNEPRAQLDWLMLGAVGGLMILGVLFIYSATSVTEPFGTWQRWRDMDLLAFLKWAGGQAFCRQIIWYAIGLAALAATCLVDYRSLSRFSLVFYWGSILLLLAVLFIGSTHGWGARRWIDIGPFNMQPSEFAKIAFLFALASFLSRPMDELRLPGNFLKAVGLGVLPFLLIMKQPDLGSALIFVPMTVVMLYAAGTPPRFLVKAMATASLLIVLFLVDILFAPPNWQIKLEDYQRRRLLVYFGVDYAATDATEVEKQRLRLQQRNDSYNVVQALISVGSGGLTGKGWREGTQNKMGYLPRAVAHNDFIFSVIAEEKGFAGSVTVLTLYAVILFCGIRTASQARDRLGRLLAIGVVTMLFSHIFINIGMNIRIMPVTGVPLPLLSYGGSSVLCSLIAVGIMLNVYLYRRTY